MNTNYDHERCYPDMLEYYLRKKLEIIEKYRPNKGLQEDCRNCRYMQLCIAIENDLFKIIRERN